MDLLRNLLARGDQVSICNGRLVLIPVSGNTVPNSWIQENRHLLIDQIASLTGITILEYQTYSTGLFVRHKAAGINMQFDCVTTGTPAYTIFNVNLTRSRTTKHGAAGSPLPDGHFAVSKRGKFYAFCRRSGIAIPKRLSTFHEYMGSLKGVLFTGIFDKGERLMKDSITPLNFTCQQLKDMALNTADNSSTSSRQHPDNSPTRSPDKESPENKIAGGSQRHSTTGDFNYGNKEQGNAVIRGITSPTSTCVTPSDYKSNKDPKNQSTAEWAANNE